MKSFSKLSQCANYRSLDVSESTCITIDATIKISMLEDSLIYLVDFYEIETRCRDENICKKFLLNSSYEYTRF